MAENEFVFDICFKMEAERLLACHRGVNTIMMRTSCSNRISQLRFRWLMQFGIKLGWSFTAGRCCWFRS